MDYGIIRELKDRVKGDSVALDLVGRVFRSFIEGDHMAAIEVLLDAADDSDRLSADEAMACLKVAIMSAPPHGRPEVFDKDRAEFISLVSRLIVGEAWSGVMAACHLYPDIFGSGGKSSCGALTTSCVGIVGGGAVCGYRWNDTDPVLCPRCNHSRMLCSDRVHQNTGYCKKHSIGVTRALSKEIRAIKGRGALYVEALTSDGQREKFSAAHDDLDYLSLRAEIAALGVMGQELLGSMGNTDFAAIEREMTRILDKSKSAVDRIVAAEDKGHSIQGDIEHLSRYLDSIVDMVATQKDDRSKVKEFMALTTVMGRLTQVERERIAAAGNVIYADQMDGLREDMASRVRNGLKSASLRVARSIVEMDPSSGITKELVYREMASEMSRVMAGE